MSSSVAKTDVLLCSLVLHVFSTLYYAVCWTTATKKLCTVCACAGFMFWNLLFCYDGLINYYFLSLPLHFWSIFCYNLWSNKSVTWSACVWKANVKFVYVCLFVMSGILVMPLPSSCNHQTNFSFMEDFYVSALLWRETELSFPQYANNLLSFWIKTNEFPTVCSFFRIKVDLSRSLSGNIYFIYKPYWGGCRRFLTQRLLKT